MGRREYAQPCGLACALDQVGERWSLLVVRELMLGPLRFSDLAREIGGAPTDVLTKRLRSLQEAGIVRRRELDPPASASVYELTALGRELERPLLELGRWGLNFLDPATIAELPPEKLANAVRVVLKPAPGQEMTVALRTGGRAYGLRISDGWVSAHRGEPDEPDLVLTGTPWEVMACLIGEDGEVAADVEGDRAALGELRAIVRLPEAQRERALEEVEVAKLPALAT
jgi:DNA-binding HxlR family transcriptional regulator